MSPPPDAAVMLAAWQYYLSAGLVLAAVAVLIFAVLIANR